MFQRLLLAATLAATACTPSLRHCDRGLFWTDETARSVLADTGTVHVYRITQSGRVDCSIAAWMRLRSDHDAARQFQLVFDQSRKPAAKIYALAGLYEVSRADYETRAHQLDRSGWVTVSYSDVLYTRTVAEALAMIENGELLRHWR